MENNNRGGYSPEELLPIVAELAALYTSKESSSVSYETAQQLMEAVQYCIASFETGEPDGNHGAFESATKQYLQSEKVAARLAYDLGYEKVLRMVEETRQSYNAAMDHFCAFENENYRDTVTKAIPGFFLYYDAKFNPQNTIITMDYPLICPIGDCTGIHAISAYLDSILLEQKFLNGLRDAYVFSALVSFQRNYRKQFYNICSVVLRSVLARSIFQGCNKESKIKLAQQIRSFTKEELREKSAFVLKKLVVEKYKADEKLFSYLEYALIDFSVELKMAAENDCLERVVPWIFG